MEHPTMDAKWWSRATGSRTSPNPYHLGAAGSPPGTLMAHKDLLVNAVAGPTGGGVASIPYSYTVDSPGRVTGIAMVGAGAGHS
jgi:hypothetical protein